MLRRGADELDPVILDRLHEIGVLREEPVAGVDRLAPVISQADMIAAMLR
jgi:hypothetical protein